MEKQEQEIAKSLRLRSGGEPVARISRKALVVASGLAIGGAAIAVAWSLAPHDKTASEPAFMPAAPPPEQVQALPRDYLRQGAPPRLGPPLPGDLGRPILAAQRGKGDAAVSVSSVDTPRYRPIEPYPRPARVSSRDVASSGLFAPTAARRPDGPASASAIASAMAGPVAGAGDDARTTSAERLKAPASPYILQAGAIIPAALITGLRSDSAGLAIAQVTQDVFDSLGGGHLLVPIGSRLIGAYETGTLSGQARLQIGWTRLILPSGRSIVLDNQPAADAQGMAGLQDRVDRHGREILGAAVLSTLLAVGAESGSSADQSDLARALRRGASQGISDVGQQAVGKSLALAPVLTIRPGAPLRVLLSRDLVLEPYFERSPR